jgi:hypothetical protein
VVQCALYEVGNGSTLQQLYVIVAAIPFCGIRMNIRNAALLGGVLLGFLTLVILISLGLTQALKMLLVGSLGLAFFLWNEWRQARHDR